MTSLAKTGPTTSAAAAQLPALRRALLVAAAAGLHAIPLEHTREILLAQPYTPLPGSAPHVCGLINLGGRLLTVLDLGVWLGGARAVAAPEHNVVVVEHGAKRIGVAVEAVARIATIAPRAFGGEDVALFAVLPDAGADASGGPTDEIVALLAPEEVLRSVLL